MKTHSLVSFLVILFAVQHSSVFSQAVSPMELPIGGGVALHYMERGEGEPIIFIHGLTGDYTVWIRQLDAFAASGYRAISYSRRYNHPNNNEFRQNHSASVEATDLAAFIDRLNLPQVHLAGHSYGAYTALIFTLEHPELVRTLTLAEPPVVPWLADLPGDNARKGLAHLNRLMNEGVNPAKAAFESGDDEVAMRTIFNCIAGGKIFQRLPEFAKERCRRNITEVKALMLSDDRYPVVDRERLRQLTVPTLILSGSESRAAAKLTDPELERLIPEQSRTRVVLEGATHNMWLEQPRQCREAVLELIQQSESQQTRDD